jgi:hypothetical protein
VNKIPVVGTISKAYGFLIGEFLTILRLTWAPLLAEALVQYYFGPVTLEATIKAMQTDDQTRMMSVGPLPFLLGIVVVVVNVMVLVALLRVVVSGDRKPGLFIYAWFGSAELRIIAVALLLGVGFAVAMVGAMIALVVLGMVATALPVVGIVVVLACIGLIVALIWAAMRLSLVGPVIVAESGLGVERSWQLMRGNALRMFGIWLATVLPISIVAGIVSTMFYGADMPAFPDLTGMWNASHGDLKEFAQAFSQAMKPYQIAVAQAQLKHWLEICVFGFVTTMISTALYAGSTGSAYLHAAGRNG